MFLETIPGNSRWGGSAAAPGVKNTRKNEARAQKLFPSEFDIISTSLSRIWGLFCQSYLRYLWEAGLNYDGEVDILSNPFGNNILN